MNSKILQFVLSVLILGFVGNGVAMLMTPPDPITQLKIVGPMIPFILVASYYISYRREYEWI